MTTPITGTAWLFPSPKVGDRVILFATRRRQQIAQLVRVVKVDAGLIWIDPGKMPPFFGQIPFRASNGEVRALELQAYIRPMNSAHIAEFNRSGRPDPSPSPAGTVNNSGGRRPSVSGYLRLDRSGLNERLQLKNR